jgi:hypothetical protein
MIRITSFMGRIRPTVIDGRLVRHLEEDANESGDYMCRNGTAFR